MSQTTNAVIAELMDRRLLNDVDDDLHQEIAEAVIQAARLSRPDTAEARLREALEECVEVLELVERPAFVDPDHGDEVAALGDRIGYGALMSSASASWRERLEEQDCPTGGEYVAGPCHKTIVLTLEKARKALFPPSGGDEAKESEGGIEIVNVGGDGSPEVIKYGDHHFDRRETVDALTTLLAEARAANGHGADHLLESIAKKFDAWETTDVWRSEASGLVRSYKQTAKLSEGGTEGRAGYAKADPESGQNAARTAGIKPGPSEPSPPADRREIVARLERVARIMRAAIIQNAPMTIWKGDLRAVEDALAALDGER